ncbi:ArsR family transcriptional regulator [Martelella endophytica]|uniref:ArsR family transcriptional regulator n=2 Tax=Martelella endophytica TaxID=1486262 RepID=A0A0D5LW93_MAREN|nr:ArsR family transcriptional regulator [Martelella endophytica]
MKTPTHLTELPHPEPEELALTQVLFALSDPGRLEIVRQIADGPMEMAQCLCDPSMPKSTKSHLMKVLRESGIVRNEPFGRGRLLTLRREDLDARFPGLIDAVLKGEG